MTNKDGISVEETRALLEGMEGVRPALSTAELREDAPSIARAYLALSEAKDAEIARLKEGLRHWRDKYVTETVERVALTKGQAMTNKDGISVEELVERLREGYDRNDLHTSAIEAADLILALSEREAAKDAEIARLREALEPFTRGPDGTSLAKLYAHLNREHYHNACAALTKGQVDEG